MKKNTIMFLILLAISLGNTNAQEIDKADIRCLYKYTFLGDLNRPDRIANDEMLLLIGKEYTYFYSYGNFIADSLRTANPAEYAPSVVTIDGSKTVVPAKTQVKRNSFSFDTYQINRKTSELICKDKIGTDYYSYKEIIKDPIWSIEEQTSNILNYECQKATTNYGGRSWVVWFTQDIAVSEGPWKLRGLPGLILKATTDDKQFEFTAIGLERNNSKYPIMIDNDKDYRLLSKASFFEQKKRFWEKPFAEKGITSITTGGKELSIQYNFIEKN